MRGNKQNLARVLSSRCLQHCSAADRLHNNIVIGNLILSSFVQDFAIKVVKICINMKSGQLRDIVGF